MKEQLKTAVLPPLPIVGKLELTTSDGKTLKSMTVTGKKETELDPFFQHCYEELKAYLSGNKKKISIKLDMNEMTPFQKKVLEVMREIPYGKTASYKDLAEKMNSRAYQAIGSACGRNPFMLIYPCHRVLGSSDIGGFAHGLKMKRELLKLEGLSNI